MKKIILMLFVMITPSISLGAVNNLGIFAKAYQSCSAVKEDLKEIQVLTGISTGTSAAGTITAGIALGAGIEKSKIDNQLANMSMVDMYNEIEKISALKEKSKKLGNIRTGTIATATVTSVATSALSGSSLNIFDKTIKDMLDCKKEVQNLKKLTYTEQDMNTVIKINKLYLMCDGFDTDNISKIKEMATATTTVSAVGAASGVVGTITSALANKETKDTKNLNLTANVASGVTTATSLTGVVLNSVTINKLKNNIRTTDDCLKNF